MGNQHSNQNLLDNWYFADPINQRGQTEYIGNADPIYTLDRWKLAGLSTSNTKLELVDGGVRITSGNVFCQIVENNVTRALIGKTVTVSALMDIEIPPVAGQLGIVADNAWIGSTPLPATTGTDILVSATISISNVSTLIPWIYSAPGGVYKLKAIKLELGPVQTLAHQDVDGSWVLNDPPPNKALELAKCQRYQYATSSYYGVGEVDGEGINIGVNFPCTMRSTPTMQTKTGIKAQMAGYGGSGFYENLTVSFRWGSPTSCVVLINVPDPSKFVMGRPVTARIDTPLLFDANL